MSPIKLTVGQIPAIEILHFLYTRLQVKTMCGNKLQREKERAIKNEKIVRYGVLLKRVLVSLINLTVGQIPVVEILHFLCVRVQVKTMQGNKHRREKERARESKKE